MFGTDEQKEELKKVLLDLVGFDLSTLISLVMTGLDEVASYEDDRLMIGKIKSKIIANFEELHRIQQLNKIDFGE